VGTWWNYGGVAIFCIILYVVGVPMMQLLALLRNRKHLHETSALDHQSHRMVKRQLGTLYDRYTDESFYFEIVNMLRRLMMTGGLILVGERSVVQALLGILTSLIWLLLVTAKFPYKAYWDNMLEIALSFSLLMSLISGFALELFSTKETSVYEQAVFDILLVLMIVGCICAGLFAIVITLPFCRTRLVALLSKCKKNNARDVLDQWTVQRHTAMKWLSTTDVQDVLDAARTSLESKASTNFQASLKKKRMHKIYPSWMTKRLNTSVEGLARTKLLAKERKKELAERPSPADIKMSPFKAVGVMVQKFMEARFHQRALHHEEVVRIHDERESNSVHLAKKQEEISKRGEENKRKLAARLRERSSK
jgi:hypothetical protein